MASTMIAALLLVSSCSLLLAADLTSVQLEQLATSELATEKAHQNAYYSVKKSSGAGGNGDNADTPSFAADPTYHHDWRSSALKAEFKKRKAMVEHHLAELDKIPAEGVTLTTEGGFANPDVSFPTYHGSKFARDDEEASLTVAKEEQKRIANQAVEYARAGKYPLGLKALQEKSSSSKKASLTTTQLAELPEVMKTQLVAKTKAAKSTTPPTSQWKFALGKGDLLSKETKDELARRKADVAHHQAVLKNLTKTGEIIDDYMKKPFVYNEDKQITTPIEPWAHQNTEGKAASWTEMLMQYMPAIKWPSMSH